MSYRPSPYRVRYRPSPDGVSSRPGPCRRPVCPCHADGTDAGRSHTDVSLCRTAISAHRSPFIGLGVRENRRSPPPLPNGDDRAPIHTGHRPGIVRTSSGQNGTSWGRCTTGPPGRMREATRHKTRKKCAGTSPDIIRHHRTSSGTRGLSRAVWPVAGYSDGDGSSRAVSSVAGSCVPSGPSRAVGRVAGSRAVGPVARSRLITALSDSATSVSLPCPRSGIPKARHLLSPGPTYACSRRRQSLCYEHIFACTPWRFMNARSAARLRRDVGPLIHTLRFNNHR